MSNENFRELPDSNKTFHEADYQVRHLSTEQLEQLRNRVASSPHLHYVCSTIVPNVANVANVANEETGETTKCP